MTDHDLLAQLQTDPNPALTELTTRYAPLAATIAARILPNRHADAIRVNDAWLELSDFTLIETDKD